MIFEPKKIAAKTNEQIEEERDIDNSADIISNEREDEDEFEEEVDEQEFDDEIEEVKPSVEAPKISKDVLWLRLSGLVRKLNDAEQQLSQKRIWWKSQNNMTGIMTMNEILDITDILKIQIKETGKELIDTFRIEDNKVNDKIKEFSAGLNVYDYWTIDKKKI